MPSSKCDSYLVEALPQNIKQSNITNINTDCMHHTFEYLTFAELLSVAETCRILRAAACDFVERRYLGKKLLGIGHVSWYASKGSIFDDEMDRKRRNESIILNTPLMAFKVLRNFRPAILNLHVSAFHFDYHQQLEFYLAKNCCDSLKHLVVTSWRLRFLNLGTPFINIESITAWDCKIFLDELQLSMVPNLKSLTLQDNRYDRIFPKMGFSSPALTKFSFKEWRYDEDVHYLSSRKFRTFRNSELIELLELNPQLEHLELLSLGPHHTSALFRSIAVDLPKLRHLTLSNVSAKLFENVRDIFHCESVEHFDLQVGGVDEYIFHIPLIFPKLRSLVIETTPQQTAFDFIAKHKNIKSIDFVYLDGTYLEDLNFENFCSGIEELTISKISDLRADALIKILRYLKVTCKINKFSIDGYRYFKEKKSFKKFCEFLYSKTTKLNGTQRLLRPLAIKMDRYKDYVQVCWKHPKGKLR